MLFRSDEVSLSCRFPDEIRALVEDQLYAQYPEMRIDPLAADSDSRPDAVTWTAELHLAHSLLPIKRYAQFEDALNSETADPLTAILAAVAGENDSPCRAWVEIIIRPARANWRARGERCVRRLSHPWFQAHHRLAKLYLSWAFSGSRVRRLVAWVLTRSVSHGETLPHRADLDMSASRLHERESDLQAASDKLGRLLFEASIRVSVTAPEQAGHEAHRILRNIGNFSITLGKPGVHAYCMQPQVHNSS